MISRQSNSESMDFRLVRQEIEARNNGYKVVVLCHKLDGGIKSTIFTKIKYFYSFNK